MDHQIGVKEHYGDAEIQGSNKNFATRQYFIALYRKHFIGT